MRVANCDYIPRPPSPSHTTTADNLVPSITSSNRRHTTTTLGSSFATNNSLTNSKIDEDWEDVEQALRKSIQMNIMIAEDDDGEEDQETAQWCWKETARMMNQHNACMVYGNPTDCWIKYDRATSDVIEKKFKKILVRHDKKEEFTLPGSKYTISLDKAIQTNNQTGFKRDIQRFVISSGGGVGSGRSGKKANEITRASSMSDKKGISSSINDSSVLDMASKVAKGVRIGSVLPKDLQGEPLIVLVNGDIVQVSKTRDDGWAFGTKLHHKDEALARELVKVASEQASRASSPAVLTKSPRASSGRNLNGSTTNISMKSSSVSKDLIDSSNMFTDTGWFELDATDLPTAEEIALLKESIGDVNTDALSAPSHWSPIKDATVVQKETLKSSSDEYKDVVEAFQKTVSSNKAKIVQIERVQNLAMWQSYVVKRQTICYREMDHRKDGSSDAAQKNKDALERFERRWLFHGSNLEVMDKILQQGFNRSFCGKNATAYGKGVYFARDASYSASRTYAVPDSTTGNQYMMACRVCVGEYCLGRMDALTPDIRDVKSHSLFDSTVGLLNKDTMSNPSIYVTYHDSQSYPEYLITFKRK